MKQKDKIIAFCEAHGSITQRQALGLGIYRLASRMSELRVELPATGRCVVTELVTVKNRDGSKSRVARYRIISLEDLKNEKAV